MAKLLFLTVFLFSLAIAISAQEAEDETEFDYIRGSERGPEHWGEIKKEWATCKTGRLQSPIDLLNRRVEIVPKYQEIIKFYNPSKAVVKNRGHDIEIKWEGKRSKIQLNGIDYILNQSHWHSPSEHTLNGHRFDMELHMVHQSADNKIAVIALLYRIGRPDPFLWKLMSTLKRIPNSDEEVDAGIINPAEIHMSGNTYYRYMGSLTTPPCTEGVTWTVNVEIATASVQQITLLREAVHDHAENNARPLQPRNGRGVNLYTSWTHRGQNLN